jgi:hypothetical protein
LRKRFASSLGSTAIVFKRATQSNPVSAKSIPYVTSASTAFGTIPSPLSLPS